MNVEKVQLLNVFIIVVTISITPNSETLLKSTLIIPNPVIPIHNTTGIPISSVLYQVFLQKAMSL